jgi:hypothetical protein
MIRSWGCGALAVAALVACGGDDQPSPDAGPGVTTAHCSFAPVAANAGTGTSAAAAALQAGAAEVALDIPVGTALGGYTGRARALADATPVDNRDIPLAGAFLPSVGVETRPMVKAVALRAGGTTVVWLKVDAIFAYEGFVFDLEDRLGESYRGKILWSTSHSHAAWAQYTAHTPLKVGASERRKLVGDRTLAAAEAAARAAIAALASGPHRLRHRRRLRRRRCAHARSAGRQRQPARRQPQRRSPAPDPDRRDRRRADRDHPGVRDPRHAGRLRQPLRLDRRHRRDRARPR